MRYAVCNELFGDMPILEAARIARAAGFDGLELAPFTLFGDFSPGAVARGLAAAREAFAATGLAFAGFHWLLVKPEGLHATTADATLRRRTWDHVAALVDAAAGLGGGVLVLGSPRQRSATGGATPAEAAGRLAEELARIAPRAAAAASPVLLEALDSTQTDVVNTLAEARALVDSVGSPGVGGMFDFHNTGDETAPWETLIREHAGHLGHVHVNEPDGGMPRAGGADFEPAFRALRELDYRGWVSVEIFDRPADPLAALRGAMDLLRSLDGDPAPPREGSFRRDKET